jgi:hypothetical protein
LKVIRQTVVTQPPAYMSYVKLTNYPNHPNYPGKKWHFFSCISQQKSAKIRQNSAGCTAAGVHSTVYTQCVHTQCVHTRQQSYNFGQDSAKFGWMYSCWCTQYSVHTVCTHKVYTRQQSYNLAFFGAGTVRRHRLRHDAWRHRVSGARVHVVDSRSRCFYGVKFVQFLRTWRHFWRYWIVSVHPGIVNYRVSWSHMQ